MAMVELVFSARRGLWQALPSAWRRGYSIPHSGPLEDAVRSSLGRERLRLRM